MKTIQATLLIFLSTYLVAQTWKPLEMHGGGKVTGIIFHPTDPQIIYNRTDVAGLNISIDAGNSWKSLTLNVPKDNPHNFTTRNLAIDPVTPTTMYYCSGNAPNTGSSSIFKSMDGGINWDRISNPTNFSGNGLLRWGDETFIIHPTNTSTLFVGGQPTFSGGSWDGTSGLHRSTDSGTNWTSIHPTVFENAWITAVKFDPGNQDIIYISSIIETRNGISTTEKGLWKYDTTDDSLEKIHDEEVVDFEFDAITNKIIVSREAGINIYDPVNDSWSAIEKPFGADYDYYITAHPTISGRWYFGGSDGFNNSGLVETLDGGENYYFSKYTGGDNIQKLSFPDFADTNFKAGHGNSLAGLYFSPHDTNLALMDGVWRTEDALMPLVDQNNPTEEENNGNWNWKWTADGIHIMVTLRVSPHPTDTVRFTVNVADVGEYKTVDGGQDMLYPGLLLHYSASTRYAPSDPNIGYTVGERFDDTGQLRKTTNGGQSWFTPMTTNFFEDAIVIQDVKIMNDNPEQLVVGIHQDGLPSQIYRSSDGGVTWTAWDQGISEPDIFREWESIDRLHRDDNNTFYVYKNDKMYYRNWNDTSWTLIPHPTGDKNLEHMILDPITSGVLYMTISDDKIYKWDNGNWSTIDSGTNISDFVAVAPDGTIVVMEKLWVSGQRTQKLFILTPGGNWQPLTFEGFGGTMKNMLFLDKDRLVGISNGQGANLLNLSENPNCLNASNFYAASIMDESAKIYWTHSGANDYILEYSEAGQNNWTTINNAATGMTISNLIPCTEYDIRVKADCGAEESNYVNAFFSTTSSSSYCASYAQSTWRYWIEDVDINNDNYYSQWNGGYYDWACEQQSSISAGDDINFSFTPGYLDNIDNVVWYVWIDFDRNGIWEDSERVVSSTASDQQQDFTIATDINLTSGPLRTRVIMHRFWTNIDLSACDAYSTGETEDFVIDVIEDNCLLVKNTADDGPGSLRAAIACADFGDTITFHPDLHNDTITITSLVMVINKDLNIIADPADNIFIEGTSVGKVFLVNVFKNVLLEGLHIIAGSSDQGRAIYNRGNCTLDKVSIYENPTKDGEGHKLWNENANLIIRNELEMKGN
jgi:photosystem II stability/assembly factor-like uncharacterized protein